MSYARSCRNRPVPRGNLTKSKSESMVRLGPERVLVVGDSQRNLQGALTAAMPTAHITSCPNYFEAIAELASNQYTAVLASAEPIERRPEAAVRTLRQMAADARLLLFGHPTLEPLSRKMLDFGCDDYVVTPVSPGELQLMFGTPPLRLAPADTDSNQDATDEPSDTDPHAPRGGIDAVGASGRIAMLG